MEVGPLITVVCPDARTGPGCPIGGSCEIRTLAAHGDASSLATGQDCDIDGRVFIEKELEIFEPVTVEFRAQAQGGRSLELGVRPFVGWCRS